MLDRIRREITADNYYTQNYSNEGQRFVAWYLRRVLLLSPEQTRQAIIDGDHDKQIDAIIVDDDARRVLVIQGKFITSSRVDSEPLREVLSAWMRLRDLEALERDCNERLKERLEAVHRALEDEYDLEFELLTTGKLTDAAQADLSVFSTQLAIENDFPATLQLVDSEVIQTRLSEAEAAELPTLDCEISLDPAKILAVDLRGTRSIIAVVPLQECLKLPGINDGRLFRKNVRQFLGLNKVNRGLRETIYSDRARDFFFYHNGLTALCRHFTLDPGRSKLQVQDLSIVNGCQSLKTIYSSSERVRKLSDDEAYILLRLYEIPQRDLADRISIFTNSQSTVKPRDLRSNDRAMLSLKKAYEAIYRDGFFINQRGAERPADKDNDKTVDCADLAKALMAWECQRPNIAYNEKRLFDEYYKTLFRPDYDPVSILALQTWLNAIDRAWQSLSLDDALKAGRSYARFHVLYSISNLIAHASGQHDKVPYPLATLNTARQYANEILPLAVNCLNRSMQNAINEAKMANRVFSPQNWCKSLASVQGETLVASTIMGMLPSLPGGPTIIQNVKVPATQFGLRWSAE